MSMHSLALEADQVTGLFEFLLDIHGRQNWWPADTPFEVMVGAVLTQNTSWNNVESSLERLRESNLLNAESLCELPLEVLAEYLYPVGYYNLKARRLTAFINWYIDQGGFKQLTTQTTSRLRSDLLSIKGIGPETADDILLYAFNRPVFVIDAYTRRLLERLNWSPPGLGYEQLRMAFQSCLPPDPSYFAEYHALIVAHGKHLCRPKPFCHACQLRYQCPYGAS